MSGSKSNPQNTTSTTTNASETNLAATNTQGVTLVGNSGPVALTSNSYSTDEGAVTAGTAVAQEAISANTNLTESLASDYENEVNTNSIASTNLVSSVLSQGFSFLADENDTIQNIEQQNSTNQSDALANYATTLSNIATAQDTSQAAQNAAFLTSTLKIAAVVVLGIALIYFATKE